ncbi:hypothetical protein B0H66DRAFT_206710 [Apodospora peruviana]|uniref:Uncharacterized protein n=1 Tax=Apodospora peruviana TaxID=516989 RepID=A0AAE0ID30_9PEZI|nr:hypothetical protein B0H66DRAFT_206710 [Apodospora peruviana]
MSQPTFDTAKLAALETPATKPDQVTDSSASVKSEPNENEKTDATGPATNNARSESPVTSGSPLTEHADHDPRNSNGNESSRSSPEPGLIDETAESTAEPEEAAGTAPPLPSEPIPGQEPPLPSESIPDQEQHLAQQQVPEDDGWTPQWNPNDNSWWFYNRFINIWQQENPRVPKAGVEVAAPPIPVVVPENVDVSALSNPVSIAGGYNPAIHGSYDENAWYARNTRAAVAQEASAQGGVERAAGLVGGEGYPNGAFFNRHTGQWQLPDQGVERHTDEAKSRRQMNAFFDVDAAANMHDGRSLKAERAGKKPTKAELKAFKEKRKAKKEEKRRAWLRD